MWIIIYLLLEQRTLAYKCPAGKGIVNGQCRECPAGYYRFNCSFECFDGVYGRLCTNTCYCRIEECHHIHGCISTTTTNQQTESQTLAVSVMNGKDKADNKQNDQWFHYIYGLIIAGLLIVVVSLIAYLVVTHKRRIEIHLKEMELRNVTSIAQINSTNGAYEYVDDNLMVEPTPNFSQRDEDINAVEISESCSDTTQSLNDSDKPHYQTLLTDSYRDVHIYNNTENPVVSQNDD